MRKESTADMTVSLSYVIGTNERVSTYTIYIMMFCAQVKALPRRNDTSVAGFEKRVTDSGHHT